MVCDGRGFDTVWSVHGRGQEEGCWRQGL